MSNVNPKQPASWLLVEVSRSGEPFYAVSWKHRRRDGTVQKVKRRLGPAWLARDPAGAWRKRRGRRPEGHLDERAAHVAAHRIVPEIEADLLAREQSAGREQSAPVTFRQIAHGYIDWLARVRGAKPSTLANYQSLLAEPGTAHRRGTGVSAGRIMAALGDLPAANVTTRQIEALLNQVADTGVAPRTVNVHRQIITTIYNYACRESTFDLAANPAARADRRREPERGPLDYYSPEEVEHVARALASGAHRDPHAPPVSAEEADWQRAEDSQDAELVRVAAYSGLRRGELVALRWADVNFAARKITVRRTVSAGELATSTKSGRTREVPLVDQAAGALDRLSQRGDFTGRDEYVFCNRLGRRLDPSAVRRRFERARTAAGLRPLRFHGLRHTYGSLLVAAGIDLVAVKSAMGHSKIATTERYLHARPAGELADRFTAAFTPAAPMTPDQVAEALGG